MSLHGITGPPDQSSRNLGNKLRLTTTLTRPNFVVFPEKVCIQNDVGAYVHFCNEAKSCAYWLVNETLWYETKTRPRRLIFSPRQDRDQDLPRFPRDRDVWKLRLETETSRLHPCILAQYTNDTDRTDRQTDRKDNGPIA